MAVDALLALARTGEPQDRFTRHPSLRTSRVPRTLKISSRFPLALILTGSLRPISAQVTLTRVIGGDLAEETGYL